MKLRAVAATHVGKVRGNNEDSYLCNRAWRLFAVADGIGGHAGGEVASALAIKSLTDTGVSGNLLSEGMVLAHARIIGAMKEDASLAGMGSTLTVCRIDKQIRVAHAGDSAAFLVRGTGIKKLTIDQHSDHGALDNCVGVEPSAFRGPQLAEEVAQAGDVVLLCTDGLTRYGGKLQIGRVVMANPFDSIADTLVEWALDHGGEDNVTVVAVRVEEV